MKVYTYGTKEFWEYSIKLKELERKLFIAGLKEVLTDEDFNEDFIEDTCQILKELNDDIIAQKELLKNV